MNIVFCVLSVAGPVQLLIGIGTENFQLVVHTKKCNCVHLGGFESYFRYVRGKFFGISDRSFVISKYLYRFRLGSIDYLIRPEDGAGFAIFVFLR